MKRALVIVYTFIFKGNYNIPVPFNDKSIFTLFLRENVWRIGKLFVFLRCNNKLKFMKDFRAKSKETFDSNLLTHTKMVINLGLYLGEQAYSNTIDDSTWTKKEFLSKLSLALALHDIGKCSALTQSYYKDTKKNEKKFYAAPTHNVLSWAFIKAYLGLNGKNDTTITKGVLHHHVLNQVDIAKTNTQNHLWHIYLTDNEKNDFIQFYTEIMSFLRSEHNITHNITPLSIEQADTVACSEYFYQDVKFDAAGQILTKDILLETVTSLIRACVILADRTVSLISETSTYESNRILTNDKEFFEMYYSNLLNADSIKGIDISTRGYDMGRLQDQKNVLAVIDQHPHTVISASAGFGKTLIGLMHFLEHRQKITWVVPRNVIASGTYKSIIQELDKIGEIDVKVALYCTGDVLESTHTNITADNLEECDIIVTNIDSLLNRNVKNNMTRMLLQAYTSTVIFDEYHEFLCQAPLFAAFIRLLWTRVYSTTSRTILLSATPMKLDCLGLGGKIHYLTETPIFNGNMNVNIFIKYINCDEKFSIDGSDSFIITNTISQSKKIYRDLDEENKLLIHANFTENDRRCIENSIYEYHDKMSNVSKRNTVVGTNIIGVGLDVSAKNVYDFVLNPESTIQRGCGRGGRFNEAEYNGSINYIVCITNGRNKLVSELFTKDLHNKWIKMLLPLDGKTITKKELYDLYEDFYEKNRKEVDVMYRQFFKIGNAELFDITPHKTKKKEKTNIKTLSTGVSYRGDSNNIFVTAKDENGIWCDPISVEKHNIEDEEPMHIDENGKNLLRKTIYEFIASHPIFKYEKIANKTKTGVNKYILKNVYGFDDRNGDYTKDKIIKLATRSDSPLPLFDYTYSHTMGLLGPDRNAEEEPICG